MTLSSILLSGFVFVNTGLAYDALGTLRPGTYFQTQEAKALVVTERYERRPDSTSALHTS